jgi:hypothetical protein
MPDSAAFSIWQDLAQAAIAVACAAPDISTINDGGIS